MRLSEFIRANRETILLEWEAAVRTLPPARELPRTLLRDDIPDLLDRLTGSLDEAASHDGAPVFLAEIPYAHALTRLTGSFDLQQFVTEYQMLRATILRLWRAAAPAPEADTLAAVSSLNETIDAAIRIAADRFSASRERTLAALDNISTAALDSTDPAAFLPRLMRVLLTTVPSIDTVGILLLEGDAGSEVLRLAAAVGLDRELEQGLTMRVGEGFAGTVAATRRPMLLHDPAHSTLVRSEVLRSAGLKLLYGVPMQLDSRLVGVAHIGTRKSAALSADDRVLFETMVHRATALLEQKRIERELEAREEELRREAAFRERFLAIVGHDLRNPLSAVLFTADTLARREDLDAAVARGVRRIASSAHRMDRMVRDVLDFTRGRQGGGIPLEPRPVDLYAICERAVQELELVHPTRTVVIEPRGDLRGVWDADRLAQLVSNLVANALDYSPADTPVTVRLLGETDDRVTLAVHNAGAPIAPELIASIFDPFRRGAPEASAQPARRGLGLGTYIARLIATAHGGTLDVDSAPGAGTTFTATLPRATPAASYPREEH